eukprot:9489190-Pyramimonas_sp.AAC.1
MAPAPAACGTGATNGISAPPGGASAGSPAAAACCTKRSSAAWRARPMKVANSAAMGSRLNR